jgi:hypothetical protein
MPRSTDKPAPASERGDVDDLDALGGKLDRALSLAAPDCTLSWSLRDRICDLSQRLCDIAARSAEPDVADRCRDGRVRCERATARVRSACAE